MKNKGLSAAANLVVTLESLSSYVNVTSGTVNIASVPSRGTFTTTSPLLFSVSPTAPIDTTCKLKITTSKDGVTMAVDTISFTTGVPQFMFADTTNNPVNLWTVTATPANPKWEASTTDFHSAPTSYTDSKTGNYLANATVTITTTNQISLVGYNNPKLSFWSKWATESRYDCGVLLISTNNGTSWTALAGSLTKPAAGVGKQVPAGMPVYEGTSLTWKREEISLSAYANKTIKLKFELRTDGSEQADGWYIDDIGIYVYAAVPVELTSFTAERNNDLVTLKWVTASELNNKGFDVQRSLDGSNWSLSGSVVGAGTKTGTTEYTYTDRFPSGEPVYYRLKQTDFDGSFKFYGAVEVKGYSEMVYDLYQNYPNPFNPETVIKYSLASDGMVTLNIYDILGTKITTLVNEAQKAGSHQVSFKPGELPSGIYFYELVTPNFSKKLKMLFLK
ncbi:MAG: immune inhibitor A [Ignavibacteriales bacterium]|nr:immune inhibitor A [Ignavibacteriales bacterium]